MPHGSLGEAHQVRAVAGLGVLKEDAVGVGFSAVTCRLLLSACLHNYTVSKPIGIMYIFTKSFTIFSICELPKLVGCGRKSSSGSP